MNPPKLLQVLPFLLIAAEVPSSCSPNAQNTAPVGPQPGFKSGSTDNYSEPPPPPPPLPRDLSGYSTTDLEIYENYCDTQVRSALDRRDSAQAQEWETTKGILAAEMERRTQQSKTQPTPEIPRRKSSHGFARRREPHHKQLPLEAPKPTPEEYPLPPGWPVGPHAYWLSLARYPAKSHTRARSSPSVQTGSCSLQAEQAR